MLLLPHLLFCFMLQNKLLPLVLFCQHCLSELKAFVCLFFRKRIYICLKFSLNKGFISLTADIFLAAQQHGLSYPICPFILNFASFSQIQIIYNPCFVLWLWGSSAACQMQPIGYYQMEVQKN